MLSDQSPAAPAPDQSLPDQELHRNAVAVRDAARARGIELVIRRFPEGTRTAVEAANAVGVALGQIVKSLVFAVGASPSDPASTVVLAMVSGSNNLDERKLAVHAGRPKAWRVDADAVRTATGFPVGGVAPFGHPAPMPTWIDEDLLDYDQVWAAAGTPEYVFGIDPKILVTLTSATVSDLAKRERTT